MARMMHSTVNQPVKKSPLLKNWEKSEYIYTGDHLIDAYLRGKQDGKDELQHILAEKFNENLTIATNAAEKLYAEAKKKKIRFSDIRIKANSITQFSGLFVANVNDFISDKFREMYTMANSLENELETESFSIIFSFMPKGDHLNEDCISADGYFLKYDQK
jgi:hypothetical protein